MTARLLFTRSFLLAVGLLAVSELVARVFFSSNVEGRFEYGYHPTAGFTEGEDGMLELSSGHGQIPINFTKLESHILGNQFIT